ncbi:MAG: GPW/gp25 family protein [Oculatellaceae cyanobacterium bins.114]|nr:GPW/gp25 family protein [Oculatellaceae cyanobacterium bins.114]
MMMQLDFPFHFNQVGHTASTDENDHIRNLIEQVLFTNPGERVNRSTFGSGLLQLVFSPNSDMLVAATQVTVQAALQQWLGDLIEVQAIEVANGNTQLQVTVHYVIRRTQEAQATRFTQEV